MKRLGILILIFLSVSVVSCEKDDSNDFSKDKGEFTDARDGKTYKWIKIGNQIWMAQNLDFTENNEYQKLITEKEEWINSSSKGWCYYDNDPGKGKTYGALYQWEAARHACPEGWHLPSDEEWGQLAAFVENEGYSGNVGGALKSKILWDSGYEGTDDFGFCALPGGYRDGYHGYFGQLGIYSPWWTITEYDNTNVITRFLDADNIELIRSTGGYKKGGRYIRCVKD